MNLSAARERLSSRLAESVYDNPVVTKEFRTRMRGWKAFTIMGSYVMLLAVVLLITYYGLWSYYSYGSRGSIGNARIGMQLLFSLMITQSILLTLIIPALTSGSITLEIEKKTLEMLTLTRLTPGKIVLGKQLSGFGYAMMLLVSSLPLGGICLMLGGVSPLEIIISYVLLAAWAFLLTSFGVVCSSLTRRNATAGLAAFMLSIGYSILASSLSVELAARASYPGSRGYGSVNPFAGLNPASSPYAAMQSSMICGLHVPIALIALILHISVGCMLLMIASTHIKYCKAERALSIRLLLLGLTVFVMWLMGGTAYSSAGTDTITQMGTTVFIFGIALASVFATGEVRKPKEQSMFQYALSSKNIFKGDLGGGIGFMLLWTMAAWATFGLTCLWMFKSQHMPVDALFWTSYFRTGVAIIAMGAGMSAIGVFASSMVTQRRNATALLALFAILSFAVYGIGLLNYNSSLSNPGNPIWHLAAFWPMTPILGSTNNWSGSMPQLGWENQAWMVTGLVYLLIGAGALALAPKVLKTSGGVREEWD